MTREDNGPMDDTSALIAFINARLDEDAALAASGESWTAFEESQQGTRRVDVDHSIERVVAVTRSWRGEHIARYDPARVLREVEGKRALLEALLNEGHAVLRPGGYTEIYCSPVAEDGAPCECGHDERVSRYAQLLALSYDAHPDYQQEWTL